ncbi:MAG: 3-deoxy-D-manno-octulosonic acid transferase [Motiliproteus sp.]|nr:3-deoxy-D-manno-octulosonic acid transferase [Motiliproteus sp.]MCW9053759.1 3-deoxy-D-manno-octulosonic acid transferase [Motiliproteus sp.]
MIPGFLQNPLYQLLLWLLAPLWLWKTRSQDPKRWLERLASYPQSNLSEHPIWIHAASLGEAKAACMLMQALRDQGFQGHFVATTTTATGAEAINEGLQVGDCHLYAPYDLPLVVRSALKQIQPQMLIVMEVEIWPNLWKACHQRDIPIVLANARLSDSSAKRYRQLLSQLIGKTLGYAQLILAQSEAVKLRYQELGANEQALETAGNLKYSLEISEETRQQGEQLRALMGQDRPIWLAASTHEGEETIALDCQQHLLEHHPDALLVLVPRHPQRFQSVAELCQQSGLSFQRRSSDAQPVADSTQVYLADTMGELLALFCAVDLTWVAGSFTNVGGHNILEPAACDCPILVGPDMKNFATITEEFLEQQAMLQATSPTQLREYLQRLLKDTTLRQQLSRQAADLTTPYRDARQQQAKAIAHFL